ncbi:hypothetical protein [Solimonas sp. SE-A11]|uniref:hypothetical protein n=1 Tax=Solimonas sp. SE-A11 TaxID=3054954 RepID=UPI00259C7E81|nr:hypothetical protein [Solimonas sp. SE-A11]MDM4772041.1 hypothetical protein [Solimonas sp. SE-A11]
MIANATPAGLRRLMVPLLLVLGASAGTAQAATPLGAPVTITTQSGYGHAVARSASGRFVVAWDEERVSGSGLYLRIYDTNGVPQGAPILVDPAGGTGPWAPALAMDATGGFVATWSRRVPGSNKPDASFNFYAQRFAANGARIGSIQHVAQGDGHNLVPTAVAMGVDGSYVVAWQTRNYSADLPIPLSTIHTVTLKVMARQYGSNGLPRGPAIVVDSSVPVLQGFAGYPGSFGVGVDAAGGFTVAFESYVGVSNSVQMRRYGPDGSARGLRTRVSQLASFWGNQPNLLVNADGSSVIAWTGCKQAGQEGCESYFQRFDAEGRKQGAITQIINPGPGTAPSFPRLTGGPNGAFMALWVVRQAGVFKNYGQAYTSTGVADGVVFMVEPDLQQREDSAVLASDANGNFVVSLRNFDFDANSGQYSSPLKIRRFLRQ